MSRPQDDGGLDPVEQMADEEEIKILSALNTHWKNEENRKT